MGGDIVSSTLDYGGHSNVNSGMFDNVKLRFGEVQEIIPPTDPRNMNKKVNEYNVYVQHSDGGTMVGRTYSYVTVSNMFGSIADNLVYTLRANHSSSVKNSQKNSGAGKGAKVLIACINGDTRNGVIIGAIHDSHDENDKKEGHHLDFTFNGVVVSINDDGELTLIVDGKTNLDGDNVNDLVGSTVKITKDGNISVTAKGEVKVDCGNAVIKSDTIELGDSGVARDPGNGVVLGSWIEPITGSPVFLLGGASQVVYGKKSPI